MSYHQALRVAVFARLSGQPAAPGPVHSSPPVNLRPPIIVIGQIVLEERVDKTSDSGWYIVSVEEAVQGQSPAQLDALSAFVHGRLDDQPLDAPAGVQFSRPFIADEADARDPDAVGGPMLVRTQSFRIFAGAT